MIIWFCNADVLDIFKGLYLAFLVIFWTTIIPDQTDHLFYMNQLWAWYDKEQLVAPICNPLERVLQHKWYQSDLDLARNDLV